MLIFQLFLSLLPTSFIHPSSCNPINHPHASSFNTANINPSNDPHPIHFTFNQPSNAQPLPISATGICLNAVLAEHRTHEHRASLPRQGLHLRCKGVWFHAYPTFEYYIWNLLFETIKLVLENLQTRGYRACSWEALSHKGRILGRGIMWPDPSPLLTLSNVTDAPLPSVRRNETSAPPLNLPVHFSFNLDDPPHPLNGIDAFGVLSIAFGWLSGQDLNKPFPRPGRKLRAGTVLLEVECERSEYRWGMFEDTLRRVEAELLARGWWSCGWEVRGGEEGGVVFARGRLWSAIGMEDDRKGNLGIT